MLEIVAIILALLIAAAVIVLALAARKPDTVTYVRRAHVNAPPEKIAPLVSDFKKWRAWSPYEDRDPELKRTYGGSESGVGATYAWEGNKNVGSGHMEILESTSQKVRIKLDFITPFKASNVAEFTFTPQAGATEVAWAMTGQNVFMGKLMSVFMDFDKMIGKDFESGLVAMKLAAERS